jgi:uncharacterized protein YwgA
MQLSGLKFLATLLYAKGASGRANEPIRGTTRLEKLVFLAQKEGGIPELYDFEPYDYGPWSSDIEDDMEALSNTGLVEIDEEPLLVTIEESDSAYRNNQCEQREESDVRMPTSLKVYRLSEKGSKAAQGLWKNIDSETKKKIEDIKRRYNDVPLTDLLRLVYTVYPEGAAASKIYDRILSSRRGSRPHLPEVERDE